MKRSLALVATTAALLGTAIPAHADPVPGARAQAVDAKVKEAQTILARWGVPVGPADGLSGPMTVRGLCAFRRMASMPTTRGGLDSATYAKIKEYGAKYRSITDIPASSFQGSTTYLHVSQTCQTMFYAKGRRWQRVLAVSTGVPGHSTPGGYYTVSNTTKGWWCSTLYPESCRTQTTGEFAYVSNYGNMYNPRQVVGAIYVHGSTSVPTYPASHGCIRVTVNDSDWLYHNVDSMRIFITGAY